jgi:hypothetical protein
MPLTPDLRPSLADGLRRRYGERLRRVTPFGFEARGEATADSDVEALAALAEAAAEAGRRGVDGEG